MKTNENNGLIIERDDGLLAVPSSYSECTDCAFHMDERCPAHACFGHHFPEGHECHKHEHIIWIRPQ